MAKTKVFAIYDAAVCAYLNPMFFYTQGQAIRAWLDACSDANSSFAKHPADFTLFQIGEYDDETATLHNLDIKTPLGTALHLISNAKPTSSSQASPSSPGQGDLFPISDTTQRIKNAVERNSERNMQ